MLPTGAARRPDRVTIHDNTVTVVDYKFGEPSPRDTGNRRQPIANCCSRWATPK
ncbi:MAG: hypothetical protein MZV63_11750 [Marinilabiliales bacterium]|nr:hypothetical protein [Marinilabiliales bacterium]